MDAMFGPDKDESVPDIMNDPAFAPPQRRDTVSSTAGSERTETCRICRSEGSPAEPLFHPCKCSGSIKFVHQECLMEWLSHSHKKHCELCKTPFRFTKLYDANMPQELPWTVFVRKACMHALMGVLRGSRMLVVATVWLVAVPWSLRWAWRWMFWIADAAWARDVFMDLIQKQAIRQSQEESVTSSWPGSGIEALLDVNSIYNATGEPFAYTLANVVARGLGLTGDTANETVSTASSFQWPQADPSILSSWTYLSSLTPNPELNRYLLDVFEGQLITCVVIVGFILVFLIREWVVQQQPLVHLEGLNNVQQQIHEVLERNQPRNVPPNPYQQFLDDAAARLTQAETGAWAISGTTRSILLDQSLRTCDRAEALMDAGTHELRNVNDPEYSAKFLFVAEMVRELLTGARLPESERDELQSKIVSKASDCNQDERSMWWSVLIHDRRYRQAGETPSESENNRIKQLLAGKIGSRSAQIQQSSDSEGSRSNSAQLSPLTENVSAPTDNEASVTTPSAGRSPQVRFAESVEEIPDPVPQIARDDSSPGRLADNRKSNMTRREGSSEDDYIPITNAGPDAKINIRIIGRGKLEVPPPRAKAVVGLLEGPATQDDSSKTELSAIGETNETSIDGTVSPTTNGEVPEPGSEPAHVPLGQGYASPADEGHDENRRDEDNFGARIASAFREEFGFEETGEHHGRAPLIPRPAPAPHEQANFEEGAGDVAANANVDNNRRRQEDRNNGFNLLGKAADWFWGDITVPNADQVPVIPPEERGVRPGDVLGLAHQFGPVQVPAAEEPDPPAPAAPAEADEAGFRDPEVLAAAAQAGLDPEALDDAEDLEGVLELIGLQGPIIGLFQTSAFCTLLVAATLLCAVMFPYVGGKLVLSFFGSPIWFCFKAPLQLASFVADVIIDVAIILIGWVLIVGALAYDFLASAFHAFNSKSIDTAGEKVLQFAMNTASSSAERLQDHFLAGGQIQGLGWSWMFLAASSHSHASLKELQDEINAVFSCLGFGISGLVDMISTGTVLKGLWNGLQQLMSLPGQLFEDRQLWIQHAQPLFTLLADLRKGALTFEKMSASKLDPTLVYWNSADRTFAIVTGYITLAVMAAIYVALDTPIMRSESGRRNEKIVRDTLKQAGGVLKVILIISIEMLVFPLYCGLLLDMAFLPLFKDATISARWNFAVAKPYTFCFVHWFIGTCYMFHFALFVGMCRKILRKGVLWFIRDPDDPTFHPVRDVLERGVVTQLRKIAFSGLVYGALVILCLGGVIWTIGKACRGIFPIYWVSTEPMFEFPMDLLLYNLVTPLAIRLLRPSDAVHDLYAWWLRRCARFLRLSHFLFDDRKEDEEGFHVQRTWETVLRKISFAEGNPSTPSAREESEKSNGQSDENFKLDGKYVLTPCSDQYRPPKPGEAFLRCDEDDVYIVDKEGNKNDHFAKIYVPPLFRARITLFMICLWIFTAVTGLCATLLPLALGRYLLAFMIPQRTQVNDIYAYSIGAYILTAAVFIPMNVGATASLVVKKTTDLVRLAWLGAVYRIASRVFKCVYVYGFVGLALPLAITFALNLYLIVPLHTWMLHVVNFGLSKASDPNSTLMGIPFLTVSVSLENVQPVNIHLVSDFTLGLLFVRIAIRSIVLSPASRAAEALRRVTVNGYFNPDIRLATRFFILPVSILAAISFLLPPAAAWLTLNICEKVLAVPALDPEVIAVVYRYSYPVIAFYVIAVFASYELMKATWRWRARIRDEVYLVGERLHNFGEKRPPVGTRSVVRRDR